MTYKILFGLFLLFASCAKKDLLVRPGTLPMRPASAQGPQFNIFPISYTGVTNTDLPLLDARNLTRGETWSSSQADHDAGIQADLGDIISFSVYYHNGGVDIDQNVAVNTLVQTSAKPPLSHSAKIHLIAAFINADNVNIVSSAQKGGNIKISLREDRPLALVKGSIQHSPKWGMKKDLSQSVRLSDSIFDSSVSIGNVRACFEYSGFVTFSLRVE